MTDETSPFRDGEAVTDSPRPWHVTGDGPWFIKDASGGSVADFIDREHIAVLIVDWINAIPEMVHAVGSTRIERDRLARIVDNVRTFLDAEQGIPLVQLRAIVAEGEKA